MNTSFIIIIAVAAFVLTLVYIELRKRKREKNLYGAVTENGTKNINFINATLTTEEISKK